MLSASLASQPLQQAVAPAADVLTATFKKNAPPAANSASFARVGKYATHALSARAADLASFARKAGDSAERLFNKGLRETWWMGQRTQTIAGEWIVRFDDFSGSPRKQLSAARGLVGKISGVSVERFTYLDGAFLLKTSQTTSYRSLATRLSALEGFRYVEPNFAIARPQAVPDDSTYSQQWAWPKINAPGAWDTTTGSKDIVVAVLDTGVQVAHPDLAANIFVNPLETPGNGIDDDGNGFVDDVRGWNFGNNTATVDNGDHGTHVAGTIGAVGNNATGVTGFSWNVSILPVDIFPDAYTSSSYYIAAMAYLNGLKLRGVNVVASNNSYGSLGNASTSVKEAIRSNADHNIMFIAGAGNDGVNVSTQGFSPATNGEPNAMAIAASNSSDGKPGFSNWGSNVDIAAPGDSIRSTTPTNNYGNKSGTSMASPHVAGLVGLAYSVVPNASYHQIKQVILDGGDPVNWGTAFTATNKRINAANTINLVRTHASGKVFLDNNRDGAQQSGESAMRGWKVYNDVNGNNSRDASEAYANVQINGQYDLILAAGAQNLKLENQTGYTLTLGAGGYAFSLAQYESTDGKDFAVAESATGAIEGIVFADSNGNGVRDGGDIPLGGAAVYLDRNNNAVLDAASTFVSSDAPRAIPDVRTVVSDLYVLRDDAITDVNVTLDITHPYVGELRLTLVHPDGTRIRLADGNGSSGDNFRNTTFDTQASTAISSGSAPFSGSYRPVDSLNGLNGKPANGGWQLEVRDGSSTDIGVLNSWSLTFNNATGDAVQFTGADGAYRFSGLASGTHRIRVVPRNGFNTIAPSGGLWTQSLTAGQVVTGRDFALQPQSAFAPSSITGQIWYDGNANATRDATDYALANWIAYIDANDNNTLDVGEPISFTDDQGAYRFDGLLAGTYAIRSVGLRGHNLSRPSTGEYNVTLAAGESVDAGAFAYFQRGISGMVYVDNNANGTKDSSDIVGVNAITVYLDTNNNAALDAGETSTLTNSAGAFTFVGLDAGTYVVRAVASGSYIHSGPSAGFYSVDLTSTNFSVGRNFGLYQNAAVSGTVYNDANMNGTFETGDTYLSGWTVYHDVNNNSALDAGEPSTTTNASGTYTLGSIKPGTQRFRLVVQSGYLPLLALQSPALTSGQILGAQDLRVVASASLTYRDADYPSSTNAGWNWAYYEHSGITSVASLDALTPVRTGVTSTTGSTAVVNINTPTPRADQFGIIWTGYINAPTDNLYTFYTNSDDGSTLSIGSVLVVDNDGAHGAQERTGSIALRQGLHAITINYFDGTSSNSISASWQSSTITKAAIPSSAAFRAPTMAPNTPTSVTAAPVGLGRIDVSWSFGGSGHTGFVVERADDSGFTQNLQQYAVASPSARSYSNTGLVAGKTYFYRVRSVSGAVESSNSNTASATAEAAPTVTIATVTPNPRTSPVSSINVTFSEAVSGFDVGDLALTRDGQSVALTGASISTSDNVVYTISGLSNLTLLAGAYSLSIAAPGGIVDGAGIPLAVGDSETWQTNAMVLARRVFYNNSAFDNNNPAADVADDGAIATDKSALTRGQATFANYTSYSKGINGIMIDVSTLGGTLSASDFAFRVGNAATPSQMTTLATLPQISVRPVVGSNSSDRITLTWADGTIKNTWLEVTLKATPNTGLTAADVFYFGNAIGETGGEANARVDGTDVTKIRTNQSGLGVANILNVYDIDRSRKVDGTDLTLARENQSGLTPVKLLQV